jgi:hypothetical protein
MPTSLKTPTEKDRPMKHLATFDNAYRVANQMAEKSGRNYAIVRDGDYHQVREYPCLEAITVIQTNDDPAISLELAV